MTDSSQHEHDLPKPGIVYAIPENTHADLDLQDEFDPYSRQGSRY
ncbi:MAG TPA: hypothetical protein VF597_01290 [Candidatus Saccharimonadales bacterium]|jgi:hypothetical protein